MCEYMHAYTYTFYACESLSLGMYFCTWIFHVSLWGETLITHWTNTTQRNLSWARVWLTIKHTQCTTWTSVISTYFTIKYMWHTIDVPHYSKGTITIISACKHVFNINTCFNAMGRIVLEEVWFGAGGMPHNCYLKVLKSLMTRIT